MGQFSGVILCFFSALLFYQCQNGICQCVAIGVGVICLWSWSAIRSPGFFNLAAKWQKRLRLTIMNAELYRKHRNDPAPPPLYPKRRQESSPDWIVAVNIVFTLIGLFLFFAALHAKFLPG
jgi:hypothetical protein